MLVRHLITLLHRFDRTIVSKRETDHGLYTCLLRNNNRYLLDKDRVLLGFQIKIRRNTRYRVRLKATLSVDLRIINIREFLISESTANAGHPLNLMIDQGPLLRRFPTLYSLLYVTTVRYMSEEAAQTGATLVKYLRLKRINGAGFPTLLYGNTSRTLRRVITNGRNDANAYRRLVADLYAFVHNLSYTNNRGLQPLNRRILRNAFFVGSGLNRATYTTVLIVASREMLTLATSRIIRMNILSTGNGNVLTITLRFYDRVHGLYRHNKEDLQIGTNYYVNNLVMMRGRHKDIRERTPRNVNRDVNICRLKRRLATVRTFVHLGGTLYERSVQRDTRMLNVTYRRLGRVKRIIRILYRGRDLGLTSRVKETLMGEYGNSTRFLARDLIRLKGRNLLRRLTNLTTAIIPRGSFNIFAKIGDHRVMTLTLNAENDDKADDYSIVFKTTTTDRTRYDDARYAHDDRLRGVTTEGLFRDVLLFFIVAYSSLLVQWANVGGRAFCTLCVAPIFIFFRTGLVFSSCYPWDTVIFIQGVRCHRGMLPLQLILCTGQGIWGPFIPLVFFRRAIVVDAILYFCRLPSYCVYF